MESIYKGIDVSGLTNGLIPEREEKLHHLVRNRQSNLTLVLENIHDPHNIHAILRTCDAIGLVEIFVITNGYPKAIKNGKKSSASARKWVEINFFTKVSDCVDELIQKRGFQLFATHLGSESKSIYEMDFTKKVAIVFGNEQLGVSEELLSFCEGNFIIPMVGMMDSLNVSVAASISLYEAYRQRLASGMLLNTQLNDGEYQKLFNHYSWK